VELRCKYILGGKPENKRSLQRPKIRWLGYWMNVLMVHKILSKGEILNT
jgi:hypothetical protein